MHYPVTLPFDPFAIIHLPSNFELILQLQDHEIEKRTAK